MAKLQGTLSVQTLECDEFIGPTGYIVNSAVATGAAIARSKLAQETLTEFAIPLDAAKVWDAMQTNIPGTPANDDLGLVTGTRGTNSLSLQTGDLKAADSTSRKAGFTVPIPPNYVDGETIVIRVRAGMLTTVADQAATVDVEAYVSDEDSTSTADLVTTAATNCNSLNFADYDFTVTPTSRVGGELLEFVATLLVHDHATANAVTGCIGSVKACFDTKG